METGFIFQGLFRYRTEINGGAGYNIIYLSTYLWKACCRGCFPELLMYMHMITPSQSHSASGERQDVSTLTLAGSTAIDYISLTHFSAVGSSDVIKCRQIW